MKKITVLKVKENRDAESVLNQLKEDHSSLQFALLEKGCILAYGNSKKKLNASSFLELVSEMTFENLETLNFLNEEIRQQIESMMSTPICPECGVNLIENPISFNAHFEYCFDPSSNKFKINRAAVDTYELPFCSNCWEQIEIDLVLSHHAITLETDAANSLRIETNQY